MPIKLGYTFTCNECGISGPWCASKKAAAEAFTEEHGGSVGSHRIVGYCKRCLEKVVGEMKEDLRDF